MDTILASDTLDIARGARTILEGTLQYLTEDHFTTNCYAVDERGDATPFLARAARTCTIGGLMKTAGYERANQARYAMSEDFGMAVLLLADALESKADCTQCQRNRREYGQARDGGNAPVMWAEEVIAHISDTHGLDVVRPGLERAAAALEG